VADLCEPGTGQTVAYLAFLRVSSVSGSVWDFRHRLLARSISAVVVNAVLLLSIAKDLQYQNRLVTGPLATESPQPLSLPPHLCYSFHPHGDTPSEPSRAGTKSRITLLPELRQRSK
jgi:hypothetical protein